MKIFFILYLILREIYDLHIFIISTYLMACEMQVILGVSLVGFALHRRCGFAEIRV